MCSMTKKLRVGVSIFVRKGEQSFWENGIFQNCLFLVMLLMKSPRIEATYLVADGDGDPSAANFLADSPVPVIDLAGASHELDLMIEMSAQLSPEWIVSFRERGGRVVSMRVGNDYVMDIERMVFDKPHALLISGARYDAVWTIPEYEATCVPYFASAFRAPVTMLPHLWNESFLLHAMAKHRGGALFSYQPGRKRWRVGMVEPNVCMVKTSYVPMLCCEMAHRKNADFLESVICYNTFHMSEHPLFNGFANSLDFVKHGLGRFEGRHPIYQIMGLSVDALVCHHLENGQNYVYYEALYGGYPLIHNSQFIGDCGYRYHGFDCEQGGVVLQQAFQNHDQQLGQYRQRAAEFLRHLDPENPVNVQAYTDAIDALF